MKASEVCFRLGIGLALVGLLVASVAAASIDRQIYIPGFSDGGTYVSNLEITTASTGLAMYLLGVLFFLNLSAYLGNREDSNA